MPKDKRLYMTFPIDFDEHPKVAPLSDAAFRAFFEMNGYCRRQRTDGRITVAVALKRWKPRVLAELVATDPEKPLVILDGDAYVLLSYADHQFTTTDEQQLHEKRSRAGKLGGEAKASAVASASRVPKQNVARSESRSESGILTSDIDSDLLSGHLPDEPVHDADQIEKLRLAALLHAERLGIKNVFDVREWLEKSCDRELNLGDAVDLAEIVLSKSKNPVENADAYVIGTCRKSPKRVAAYSEDLDLAVAS